MQALCFTECDLWTAHLLQVNLPALPTNESCRLSVASRQNEVTSRGSVLPLPASYVAAERPNATTSARCAQVAASSEQNVST